jgi:hypothetical protein
MSDHTEHPAAESLPTPSMLDRRQSKRYASQQEVSCRSAAGGPEGTPAQVKDVSESGVGLLMARRFEPGSLVLLEVQGATASYPVCVLARVVRVGARKAGQWVIGCSFVDKISAEEFKVLRAEGATSAKKNRRAWVRVCSNTQALCRSSSPALPGQWAAEVRDLSPGGIGLLVTRTLEVGTMLKVAVPVEDGQPPCTMQVQVLRRERQPDGRWLLGCELWEEPSRVDSTSGTVPLKSS